MTKRGQDFIARAQILVDRLGLAGDSTTTIFIYFQSVRWKIRTSLAVRGRVRIVANMGNLRVPVKLLRTQADLFRGKISAEMHNLIQLIREVLILNLHFVYELAFCG